MTLLEKLKKANIEALKGKDKDSRAILSINNTVKEKRT